MIAGLPDTHLNQSAAGRSNKDMTAGIRNPSPTPLPLGEGFLLGTKDNISPSALV